MATRRSTARLFALTIGAGLLGAAGPAAADRDEARATSLEQRLEHRDAGLEHWRQWRGEGPERRDRGEARIARLRDWLARWFERTPDRPDLVAGAPAPVGPRGGPGPAVPEPGSALVFAAGLLAARAATSRKRRGTGASPTSR